MPDWSNAGLMIGPLEVCYTYLRSCDLFPVSQPFVMWVLYCVYTCVGFYAAFAEYCIVLPSIVLYCIVSPSIVLYCIVPSSWYNHMHDLIHVAQPYVMWAPSSYYVKLSLIICIRYNLYEVYLECRLRGVLKFQHTCISLLWRVVSGSWILRRFQQFSVISRRPVVSTGGKSTSPMWRRYAAKPASDGWWLVNKYRSQHCTLL